MKTVIVSQEIIGPHRNGGIGTFATNWAILLRQHGHDVTIIYPALMETPQEQWIDLYDRYQIEVIHAPDKEIDFEHQNYHWFVRRAEQVTSKIPPDADIIYFQECCANGYHYLRSRQYRSQRLPICVSVLHSSSEWIWEANKMLPPSLIDMEMAFAERYTVERSDYAVSPSQYMMDYVKQKGWPLPSENRLRVLGYPFIKENIRYDTPLPPAEQFRRIVFFGRIETRKGIEVFVDALQYLHENKPEALHYVEEICLLGRENTHRFGTTEELIRHLQLAVPQAQIRALTTLGSHQAQQFLAEHAHDTLVVAPSLFDNMPYAVIEASLMPGLNIICSNYGGQPEILGESGSEQYFSPQVRPFAQTLGRWLLSKPRSADQLAHYDWKKANARWIAFHEEICAVAQQTTRFIPSLQPKSADVCMAYFNHPDYLPSALKALDRQTTDNYNLFVVNDGSTEPRANEVFSWAQHHYSHRRNWHFIQRDENCGLSETRNYAASLGESELLIFADSDNISSPNMVERFVESITISDLDCLTCNIYWFQGDDTPFLSDTPGMFTDSYCLWTPHGPSVELGVFSNVFGDANFVIRRKIFDEVGGFAIERDLDRHTMAEDWELLTRLTLGGYRLDVIPEVLVFHRSDNLTPTTKDYDDVARPLRVYQRKLQEVGLQQLIPWIYQLSLLNKTHHEEVANRVLEPGIVNWNEQTKTTSDPTWLAEHIPWSSLLRGLLAKVSKRLRR